MRATRSLWLRGCLSVAVLIGLCLSLCLVIGVVRGNAIERQYELLLSDLRTFETGESGYRQDIRALSLYIERHPDDPIFYLKRGQDYEQLHDLEHALTDFDQAVALDPSPGVAYFYRGRLYYTRWLSTRTEEDRQKATSDLSRFREYGRFSGLQGRAEEMLKNLAVQ